MKRPLAPLLVLLCVVVSSYAQYMYVKPIDVPGADWTAPSSVNNRGTIVGAYSQGMNGYGFLLSKNTWTSFDKPDVIWGLNDHGDMVGNYPADNGHRDGFLLRKGTFTTLNFPGADYTLPISINNAGTVVGYYQIFANSTLHGFIWKDGQFTDYIYPGAGYLFFTDVTEQGELIGFWWNDLGACDNFLMAPSGKYVSVNAPWADPCAQQISKSNPQKDIVGGYFDENGMVRGYAFVRGEFQKLDVPDSVQTVPWDINASGQITGWYTASDFVLHGFLAQPESEGKPTPQ
ncbi:MAG TPA: hypothetical protein VFA68_22125 [Terriglobales bacterium]|nr:hypothetical protein [Terriglobales bacterium]